MMQKYIDEAEKALLHTYNRYQIVLDKGDGVYLYDIDGKKYLDFVSGIAVFALGYNNKEYNDALKNQIARSGDEETVFVNKKTDCLKSLDEAIKKFEDGEHEDELNTLKKIHEQVSAKSYNPETIGPDICNFVEMSKLFE
jgi:acetylornithine/succinyldiaminopimelate/putrescine aminotransferase